MPNSRKPADYLCIFGIWEKSVTTPVTFLSSLGLSGSCEDYVQLVQTYSRCDLEPFDPSFPLDFHHLEQYRAFGPEWELWLRHVNAQDVRFRFIGTSAGFPSDWRNILQEKGFTCESTTLSQELSLDRAEYPLVGEPLRDEQNTPLGWYTERIPRLLSYPAPFPARPGASGGVPKTLLTVENLRCPDGSVELVRFYGLKVTSLALQKKSLSTGEFGDGN